MAGLKCTFEEYVIIIARHPLFSLHLGTQMDDSNTNQKIPDEIKRKLELFTPLQRRYCEFRAKGLKQSDAAEKAGSSASERSSLGRVGYNIENTVDGAKEYINWLMELRARQACVDENEIIHKIRDVYDRALEDGKYAEANKAAQMLGEMIGAFNQSKKGAEVAGPKKPDTKNDVNAFKDAGDTVEERAKRIRTLLKEVD